MYENSYRRYAKYRDNRNRYEYNQIAIPVTMFAVYWLLHSVWFIALVCLAVVIYTISKVPYERENKQFKMKPKEKKVEMTTIKSTDKGYLNKNNQKNLGKTKLKGNDHMQWFYQMECLDCGHVYYSNGSDIWQRRCPHCQGGIEIK